MVCTLAGCALGLSFDLFILSLQRRLSSGASRASGMNNKSLAQLFADNAVAGVKTAPALHFAVADITKHIGDSVAQGTPIRAALRSAGINEELASSLEYNRNSSESITKALRLTIGGGGGITGVPTAECLHKYLPPDRDPTENEIAKAWKLCQK
jgi:hypothetical protein